MSEYVAVNGQVITEDMIDRWVDAYDKGEFPEGERSAGKVIYGRPPLSSEGSETISVKVAPAMKRRIKAEAAREGVTTSDYVRGVLAEALLA